MSNGEFGDWNRLNQNQGLGFWTQIFALIFEKRIFDFLVGVQPFEARFWPPKNNFRANFDQNDTC